RELQSRRKPHPRGIGIELPGMNRQHRGRSRAVRRRDRSEDAARRAHAEPPTPPHRHRVTEPVGHERRYFSYRPPPRAPYMRISRIADIADDLQRRHARVRADAALRERVEGPE